MASINPTSVQCSPEPHTEKQAYLKLEITSISDSDAATNKRYVGWKLAIYGTPWVGLYGRQATLGGLNIVPTNGTAITGWLNGHVTDSGTSTFNNDASGNLTLTAFVKQLFYYYYSDSVWNSVPTYAQQASTNMVCSQLPRYATFTKHEISSTEINKVSVTWAADATIDSVQYSLNNGAWTTAAYPTYTISGLSPNTTYSIKTRIRRKDSQLWTTSGNLSVTTKSLPSTNTPSNFNLGSSPTASISSTSYLSSWRVDVYDGATLIAQSGNVTSASKVIDLTDATLISNMLSRHTTSSSWTITFKYYCTSNGTNYTLTERTCTCSIPTNDYLPTFTESNISYEVTDALTLNLTGSNKKIIKGVSSVQVTCTPASPQGGASMSSYNSTSGNSTASTTNISTPVMNLSNVNANSVVVQAVDSRNKSKSITKNYNDFIDYFVPNITSTSISRIDGIGTNLNVNITGTYCDWQNLSTTNIITQVSIKYKLKSASTYTTITGVNLTITNNAGTFNVTGIISGNYFVATDEYDLLITLEDKINTFDCLASIPTGESFLWRDLANKRLGIKTKPDYDLDVNGTANIRGDLQVTNDTTINNLIVNNDATINNNLVVNNDFQVKRNIVGQLKKNTGSSWIGDRDNALIKCLITVASGAYFPVISQKTATGNWTIGNLSDSNTNNNLLFNYTTDANYSGGTNASTRFALQPDGYFGVRTACSTNLQSTGRIANANITHSYENNLAHLRFLQATGTMTANKPPTGDGYILHCSWDNDGQYNSQLALPNSGGASPITFRGCSNGTWGNWEYLYRAKGLYDNSSGTNGTVTLSESSANFSVLEIYYKHTNDGTEYGSTRVFAPNGKRANLELSWGFTASGVVGCQTLQKNMNISGTSITNYSGRAFNVMPNSGTWAGSTTSDIYVTKVIGYR